MAEVIAGGINPDDGSFVPFAVNAAGMAKVEPPQLVEGPPGDKGDQGDPGPRGEKGEKGDPGLDAPQWEEGTWTPSFGSTEDSGELICTYGIQLGKWWKLGNMVWCKANMQTSSCAILGLRGYLIVEGMPFTWVNDSDTIDHSGLCLRTAAGFANNIFIPYGRGTGMAKVFRFDKRIDDTNTGVELVDLKEHVDGVANQLSFSFWGFIRSTDTPQLTYENGKLVDDESSVA